MAQYTNLSNEELKSILAIYDIPSFNNWTILGGGSQNTNFFVDSDSGEYVLTFCEQKTHKKAQGIADLLMHLEKNGFSTSKIIKTKNGESVIIRKGKPIMLKEYLHGEVVSDLSKHLLELIGEELGQLHQVKVPSYLPSQFPYGKAYFRELDRYAPDAPFYDWLKEIKRYVEEKISEDLPKALIHGDVFYNNVVVSEDQSKTTIFDFEEACYYYRVFDLGMVIIGSCAKDGEIDLGKARSLLKGYERETILLEVERSSLKAFTVYAAAATAFWRFRNFRFIKPEPDLYDHYIKMKELTDFVRGLDDDCFL